ncbi:MAG: Fe-S cluster assembly protein SufD [Kiritimatiellia bacterium]|jgi:Fe-S cluster assembly protein SufD|nr:Fe-S cluster assembly protein SufD [Kiritimatiellia bacterium]MDP6630075.1 Fe-S cluster assembly protein SufD [Kiritimatiellia bacterium]MDP6811234.1 Fe-S cluster assembly protein SufD [Kiritimatiellia bacterium]MDP7024593.1 Fe-S cluster assembly protein SufD [Kiritimatiellia bacterium]
MKRLRAIPPARHYGEQLDALLAQNSAGETSALQKQRQTAYDRFMAQGIPTRRVEAWKYTDVTRLAEEVFRPVDPAGITPQTLADLPYCHDGDERLVFVEGILQPDLTQRPDTSPLKLSSLSSASESAPQEVPDNPFVALNGALWRDGSMLDIPANQKLDHRVHVLFLHAAHSDPSVIHPRLHVRLGAHAEARVVVTYAALGDGPCLNNAVLDVDLAEGAQLSLVQAQVLNEQSTHLGFTRITQGRDSHVASMDFHAGSALARHDLTVALDGEGASATLNGLYAVRDRQHVDCHTGIEHRQPNCSSRQLYKGILNDRATAAFDGLVRVHPGASGSDGEQVNRNLLLSNDCQANAKPRLEIANDDVRCTHGATVGQLNDQELFYLESRGIDPAAARDMLSRGFAEEVLYRMDDKALHADLHAILDSFFEASNERD